MAKIGGKPDSESSRPPGRSGEGIGPSQSAVGAGHADTAKSFGATFVQLKDSLQDLYGDQSVVAYAGSFNSETASMEIRTEMFDKCSHHEELVANCEDCGRKPGNNISLLTGRGDGVYSGISYSFSNEEMNSRERIGEHLASIYLFDQDIAFAQSLIRSSWHQPEDLFIEHFRAYRHLQGSVAGDIVTGPDGFWISDQSAHPGSRDACINHFGSDNKSYVVVVYHEPIDESKMYYSPSSGEPAVDADGKLKTPVRPRLVLIVERQFAAQVFGGLSHFPAVPWPEQPHLWMNMIVAGHAAGDNGLSAIRNDGVFWRAVVERQAQFSDEGSWINKIYRIQALGYFMQLALLGDESCRDGARSLIVGSGTSPLTSADVKMALRLRAQNFDDKAAALALELLPKQS